jgi:hypothetical protein
MFAACHHPKSLPALLSLIGTLEKADQVAILTAKPANGWNVLLIAARYQPKSLPALLSLIGTLEKAAQVAILTAKSTGGWNVLLIAARYQPESVPALLLSHITNLMPLSEIFSQSCTKDQIFTVLTAKNRDGENALMFAARHHPESVPALLDQIKGLDLKHQADILKAQSTHTIKMYSSQELLLILAYARTKPIMKEILPSFLIAYPDLTDGGVVKQYLAQLNSQSFQAFLKSIPSEHSDIQLRCLAIRIEHLMKAQKTFFHHLFRASSIHSEIQNLSLKQTQLNTDVSQFNNLSSCKQPADQKRPIIDPCLKLKEDIKHLEEKIQRNEGKFLSSLRLFFDKRKLARLKVELKNLSVSTSNVPVGLLDTQTPLQTNPSDNRALSKKDTPNPAASAYQKPSQPSQQPVSCKPSNSTYSTALLLASCPAVPTHFLRAHSREQCGEEHPAC